MWVFTVFLNGHSVLGGTLATPFEASWRSKEFREASWRHSELVLGSSFFKSAFSEDVPHEITTFAAPRAHRTGPKSLCSCLALAPTLFQTALTLRITFFHRLKWPCKQPWEVHAIPPT